MKNPRRLSDDAVEALRKEVAFAYTHTKDFRSRDQERLEDIYSQKALAGVLFTSEIPQEGVSMSQVKEVRVGAYQTGSTTANLLTSRLRQIYVSTTPGMPHFTVEPRTAGAAKLAESQEVVSDVALARSNLDAAMRRAAWLDPLQNYVGVRLHIDERSVDYTDRVQWEVIESEYCGIEPFGRRFRWHGRSVQWASLDEKLRAWALKSLPDSAKEPHPWEPVGLMEVFDTGFALEKGDGSKRPRCRVHVWVNFEGSFYKDKRRRNPDLGNYVVTYDLRACPLGIEANMPAAPHEDVAPVEAATWMGLIDAITDTLEQIRREIMAANNIVLYDSSIDQAIVSAAMSKPPGTVVYIPVPVSNESRGISHTMRPVERNSLLGELVAALQTYLALLDDVTGVGPQDRGQSINPSKTATEAGVLAASSSRSTAARLRVQQQRWTWALETLFEFQREIYGKELEVPLDGVVRTLVVPDPTTCRYAFRIGVDEMDNLARRGRLDSNMMVMQVMANAYSAFPNGMPKGIREAVRRVIKAAGWVDADAYFPMSASADGPYERYITALETGNDLPVYEDDEHMQFIAEYGKILARGVSAGSSDVPIQVLSNALQKHEVYARVQAAQQAQGAAQARPMAPGMSAQGDVDNNIAAALEAGLPPQMSPQLLR